MSPIQFFESQIRIISNAVNTSGNNKIIIAGDFNLDESKRFAMDYTNNRFFELNFLHFSVIHYFLNSIQLVLILSYLLKYCKATSIIFNFNQFNLL